MVIGQWSCSINGFLSFVFGSLGEVLVFKEIPSLLCRGASTDSLQSVTELHATFAYMNINSLFYLYCKSQKYGSRLITVKIRHYIQLFSLETFLDSESHLMNAILLSISLN